MKRYLFPPIVIINKVTLNRALFQCIPEAKLFETKFTYVSVHSEVARKRWGVGTKTK
jgi:hypothetical protein